MDMLRVVFMVGVSEAHLEVLGYEDLGLPVGEVLYRGAVASMGREAADAQEMTEWLIEELCNVRKLYQTRRGTVRVGRPSSDRP